MSFGIPNVTLPKNLQTREVGYGTVRRTDFLFDQFPIVLADNAGVTGFGSAQLYTFPLGLIFLEGIVVNVTGTRSSTGLVATFRDIFGLGTVAADNTATLTTTEQDLLLSTAAANAVAGVATLTQAGVGATAATAAGVALAASVFDWTTTTLASTPKKMFFNHLINTADETIATTPANLLISGIISMNWQLLGDR